MSPDIVAMFKNFIISFSYNRWQCKTVVLLSIVANLCPLIVIGCKYALPCFIKFCFSVKFPTAKPVPFLSMSQKKFQ